jgi:hypothetical protein
MGAVYVFTQKVGAFGVHLSWARKILFVINAKDILFITLSLSLALKR